MWRTDETPLARAILEPDQVEVHEREIAASPDQVWESLTQVRLVDIPVARVLMRLRHPRGRADAALLLSGGPVPPQRLEPPHHALGFVAHQPWAGRRGPALDPDDPLACPPGWVVTGTEFVVTASDGGTTPGSTPRSTTGSRIMTQTRCRATSAGAGRAMRAYWLVIGPFSGLVRRELLRAVARRAERGK